VRAPCDTVAVRVVAGYVLIALGVLTVIFGPIAGSMLDLLINGAKWETPRGSENMITNMPSLVGAIFVVVGVVVVVAAV